MPASTTPRKRTTRRWPGGHSAFLSEQDARLALMDDDVEAVPRLVAMEGDYHGHAGIRRWWGNVLDVVLDFSGEVVGDVRDLRELTLAAVRTRGHGAGSDTPFEDTIWLAARWRREVRLVEYLRD